MNKKLYSDVSVNGLTEYKNGDWKSYAVHDDLSIQGFFGPYRFLSNFEPCSIFYNGFMFKSSEAAYQSAKFDTKCAEEFVNLSATDSWKLANSGLLDEYKKPNWSDIKYDTMLMICSDKFRRNIKLSSKLRETGTKYLEETNHWGDTFWGVDYKTGEGTNALGIILMDIRDQLSL
jgi:ribA/ribD-fused uncharacterized protein